MNFLKKDYLINDFIGLYNDNSNFFNCFSNPLLGLIIGLDNLVNLNASLYEYLYLNIKKAMTIDADLEIPA